MCVETNTICFVCEVGAKITMPCDNWVQNVLKADCGSPDQHLTEIAYKFSFHHACIARVRHVNATIREINHEFSMSCGMIIESFVKIAEEINYKNLPTHVVLSDDKYVIHAPTEEWFGEVIWSPTETETDSEAGSTVASDSESYSDDDDEDSGDDTFEDANETRCLKYSVMLS